jgi:hypothetical protein
MVLPLAARAAAAFAGRGAAAGGRSAFGAAIRPIGVGFAKAAVNRFDESPSQIMADAADPNVPALEVLTRARLRSSSGRLVQAAQEAIARRPSLAQRIFG